MRNFSFRFISMCALLISASCWITPTAKRAPHQSLPETEKNRLANVHARLIAWAPKCKSGGVQWITKKKIVTPIRPTTPVLLCTSRAGSSNDQFYQEDFDSTLFLGLLCSSGKKPWACKAVEASQDSRTGRVFRSPRLKRMGDSYLFYTRDVPEGRRRASFSRDMAAGVLLYLISPGCNGCRAFGNRWTVFINRNKGLCPAGENAGNLTIRSACWVTPDLYVLYNRVAGKVGFAPLNRDVMKLGAFGKTVEELLRYSEGELLNLVQREQLKFLQKNGKGYELDLLAINLYTHLLMGDWNGGKQYIANELARRNPANLFFAYIARGPARSQVEILDLLLPTSRPTMPQDWLWEKDYINASSSPVQDAENVAFVNRYYKPVTAYVWDLIFVIDLLLNDPARDKMPE